MQSWCEGKPSNGGVINRTRYGCAFLNLNQSCLVDVECKLGEIDSQVKPSINQFVCQYSPSESQLIISLPTTLDTLESGFVLHINEFLLSSNKNFKLTIQPDGNLVVLVICIYLYSVNIKIKI